MGGRIPYGFRLQEGSIHGKRTKTYVPCEEEAGQIQLMYKLYSDPSTSYGDIVSYFQAHGLTCRGKPWERARIADHLKNPVYVRADLDIYEFFQQQGTVIESPQEDFIGINGCYYYKGRSTNNRKQAVLKDNRLVLAPHEGLIPSAIWLKCHIKCLQNKQIQPARKVANTWLAGLAKCGRCHYALVYKKYKARRSHYLLCSHTNCYQKSEHSSAKSACLCPCRTKKAINTFCRTVKILGYNSRIGKGTCFTTCLFCAVLPIFC